MTVIPPNQLDWLLKTECFLKQTKKTLKEIIIRSEILLGAKNKLTTDGALANRDLARRQFTIPRRNDNSMREIRYRAQGGGYSWKGPRVPLPGLFSSSSSSSSSSNSASKETRKRRQWRGRRSEGKWVHPATKALLCSRHVIDGEWFTVSLHDAGEKRLPFNASGNDALGATRCSTMHRQRCTPDLVGAFIAANLRGVSSTETIIFIHVARELTFIVLYGGGIIIGHQEF